MFVRGFAAFLGVFTVINLVGELVVRRFDSNFWWINLSPLAPPAAQILLISGAISFWFSPSDQSEACIGAEVRR